MTLFQRRSVRWGLLGFFLFVLLLSFGRLGQVYLDSQLKGARGPYLQMPSPNAMTIRWQTEEAVQGVVQYGRRKDKLDKTAQGTMGKIHEVRLSGLRPDTRYYYRITDTTHTFRTAPRSERPLRFWVQGDAGRASQAVSQVRDAAQKWAAKNPRKGLPNIDLWLTTGDNAYSSGKDEEFQKAVFAFYPKLLPTVPYLPAHGNHDARRNAFYQLFTFPTQGEAGGVPSGSERYFSLDYGLAHLIFLDSHGEDLSVGSPMLQWLKRDLLSVQRPWVIVLMHHPAYTKGSHNSDKLGDSKGRMFEVRENINPLLEQFGVDLVLYGHSHVYERSHLMSCHYDTSDTYSSEMALQQSESGDYRKEKYRMPLTGTIYNVVGSSAYADNGPLDHPAMAVSKKALGSLMIDIVGNKLQANFISADGKVLDSYSITKEEGVPVKNGCD